MVKVFDGIMVHSEIDMLELRMHILDTVVDHFVIVEAGETHTGIPKAAIIGEALNSERFAPFADKIIYHFVPHLEGATAWDREHFNRDQIAVAVNYFAQPDDWWLVADVDEIPTAEAVDYVLKTPGQAAALELAMYYYDFHHRLREGWGIGMCKWGVEQDANKVRRCSFPVPHITVPDAGVHLSYFMSPEQVAVKLDSFMHAADVAANTSRDPFVLKQTMDAGKDLFGRGIQIDYLPQPEHLPAYVLANRERYTALGWLEA